MESIGAKLVEERNSRNISLREASDATKIREDFLNCIEQSNFDKISLPSIYVRGFIKNYAQFLKLNAEEILTQYDTYALEGQVTRKRQQRESLGYLDISDNPSSQRIPSSKEPETEENMYAERRPRSVIRQKILISSSMLKLLGIVTGSALIVFALVQFIGPKGDADVDQSTPSPALANIEGSQEVTFMASDEIKLTVTEADSQQVLFSDYLAKGEGITLAKKGRIIGAFDEGNNLIIQRAGRQSGISINGPGRIAIP